MKSVLALEVAPEAEGRQHSLVYYCCITKQPKCVPVHTILLHLLWGIALHCLCIGVYLGEELEGVLRASVR
jgi:hypothetical protein